MARESQDLYNVGSPEFGSSNDELHDAVKRLYDDFWAHNHDGTSSRQLENIIARSIQVQAAVIAGHRLYEAVVGPAGGDFKTVSEALRAGRRRIFVRNGTYLNEPIWECSLSDTEIIGESIGGVDISFKQDTNNRNIHSTAQRLHVSTMKLTAFDGVGTELCRLDTSATFPIFENCILKCRNQAFFNGTGLTTLFATFRNCYFDMTTTANAAVMKAFAAVNNSVVENCFFDLNGITSSDSGIKICDTCINLKFVTCEGRNNQSGAAIVIANNASEQLLFSGCHFFLQSIGMNSPKTRFQNCFFETNGNAPADSFLMVSNEFVQVLGNRIKVGTADPILKCNEDGMMFDNNSIEGGSIILITHNGVINGNAIRDNLWVTTYDSAAPSITLTSSGANEVRNTIVTGNSVWNRGGTNTPVITDNGTSSTIANNEVYLS